MKILIIGGTGFISHHIVRLLVEAGHHVTALTRGFSDRQLPAGVESIRADRSDDASLRNVLKNRSFDAAIDMVAYYPQDSASAVRVLKGRIGRFIHCSTISVYMVSDQVTCPITEDQDKAPLMSFWQHNPFGMSYGIKKRECEKVLWEAHDEQNFPVSMLRPTFVSGPGDPAKRDFFWVERILDGQPILVPGTGEFAFQQVFVEDVARAFVSVLDHPASIGKAYNIASEEIYTLNQYLKMITELLGRNLNVVHVDQESFDLLPFSRHPAGDAFPFNVRRTAVFSLERAKADLEYVSTPLHAWMPQTISWFTSQKGEPSVGYERREEEVEFTIRWKARDQGAQPQGRL